MLIKKSLSKKYQETTRSSARIQIEIRISKIFNKLKSNHFKNKNSSLKTIIMSTTTLTKTENQQVILLKNDYELLNEYVKNLHGMQVNEKENYRKLSQELSKAELVSVKDFPKDIVRLDSTVIIKDLQTKRDMTISIVMPQNADIKQRKVSVLAPIGTALIGFRKGQKVSWEVPAGKKDFMIMDVENNLLPEK